MLVILYIGCEADMLFARPEDTDVACIRWPTPMFLNEGPTNHMLPNSGSPTVGFLFTTDANVHV